MKNTAKIELLKKITPKVYLMRLKMTEPNTLDYDPGQFVSLDVGGSIRRSYSIAYNSPDKSTIDLYNDIEPGGPGSQFFVNAKVGQAVSFLGPLGMFTYQSGYDISALFIATGTGNVPIYNMILHALKTEKTTRSITLIQGFRFEEDIFLDDEFKKLDEQYRNFRYMLSLTRPESTWNGLTGRVTEILEKEYKGENVHTYICGGQSMISSVVEFFSEKGLSSDNIFYEKFY
jgi:NAD(P)H-flavin reductase